LAGESTWATTGVAGTVDVVDCWRSGAVDGDDDEPLPPLQDARATAATAVAARRRRMTPDVSATASLVLGFRATLGW
jgi:hypothetical protein